MRLTRFILVICLFWTSGLSVASADNGSPPAPNPAAAPQPTSEPETQPSPVVDQPTIPPVVQPAPAPTDVPAPAGSPPSVTQERGSSVVTTVEPSAPTGPGPSGPPGPGQAPQPATSPITRPGAAAGSSVPQSESSSSSSPGVTLPPDTGPSSPGDSTANVIDVNSDPTAGSAPEQLSCSSRHYPVSAPFMVSPYGGWTSVNSFFDHDSPNYLVDGTIVLANGLRATTSDGQASDMFPAYWSPSLRQYVNYDGHNGYDFGISYQPVLAAAAGTVTFAGWNGSSPYEGYGQMVLIDHHNGYATLYGHLSSLEVSKGDKVAAGQEIGVSGSTGRSSGPHLHFSVFHNCAVTDPYGWTGSGKDPLKSFNQERAAYLWLPGHDPLVLNPPPSWPSYPLGLSIVVPGVSAPVGRISRRSLPPADRLLLLDLPAPTARGKMSVGAAMARTESLITQEAEAITPYLDDFKSQGLIESYQIIPAAAAIWVRGIATAAQLEGLPGVASLSGVQPTDLRAAQAGLSHSVLIQIGVQQAPSLWPVGFRSALHAWRPVITAVNGHALVEGCALPGQHVVVSLSRDGQVPGASEATGDPDTGGFVTMLHDQSGEPVNVKPGDRVEVSMGGRQAAVTISRFSLQGRSKLVSGRTRPGATVPVTLVSPSGSVTWRSVATAGADGTFRVPITAGEAAGTLAVATVVDAAGDQQSAAAYLPGMVVDMAAQMVRGWTVAHDPSLQVWRKGRPVVVQRLHPASDGSFRVVLAHRHPSLSLLPGDVVSIGSQWHRNRMVLPTLRLSLPPGSSTARVTGPPGHTLTVTVHRLLGRWTQSVALNSSGHATVPVHGGPVTVGDSIEAESTNRQGNTLLMSAYVRGVVLHEGAAIVSGQVAPGHTLNVRLSSAGGRRIGAVILSPDPQNGAFMGKIQDSSGRPAKIQPGMRLFIQDADGELQISAPALRLTLDRRARAVTVQAEVGTRLVVTLVDGHGHRFLRRAVTGSEGQAQISLRGLRGLAGAAVSTLPSDGVSFERSLRLPTRQPQSRASRRAAVHTMGRARR